MGFSTRKVAELLPSGQKLTHATVANYERGLTPPSASVLATLADLYQVDLNWLLSQEATISGARYRSLKKASLWERHRFEVDALRWLNAYRALERTMGSPIAKTIEGFDHQGIADPETLAANLRMHLRLGQGPVPSIMSVLESFGIRAVEITSNARIDALAGHLGDEPVVVINAALPNDRARLTAAHELGHILYEDCAHPDDTGNDDVERRAFEFASHFLLPDAALSDAFQGFSMVRLLQFKTLYGVSLAAMIFRAKRAHVLSSDVYSWLWRQFSQRGWRKHEPGDVAPDRPLRFERLLETAIKDRRLDWEDAAVLTKIGARDLRDRLSRALGGHSG